MKTLLKVLALVLAIVIVFALAGCNKKDADSTTAPATSAAASTTAAPAYVPNPFYLFIDNPNEPAQEYVQHPSVYAETHVSGVPVPFNFDVPSGYIGIIGGFNVDGTPNGVYKAFGPGNYQFIITDGFGLITVQKWASDEFQFRLDQAAQYKWAHDLVDWGPLTAPAQTNQAPVATTQKTVPTTKAPAAAPNNNTPNTTQPATAAPTAKVRVETGTTGEWKSFKIGDSVVGMFVTFDNGVVLNTSKTGYYLPEAKMPGKVQYGVINYWVTEITNQQLITFEMYK